MLRRLLRELSDNYTDNLIYELRNYVSVRDRKGNNVVEGLADFNRISEWIRLFEPKVQQRSRATFPDVARAMNVAVTQYWWMCVGIQNRLQGIVNEQGIDEPQLRKLIQGWNNGREGANRFFVEWSDLSEKINADLPEHLGSAQRSPLKSIG
jgi:hypothetical protein